ncbi:hypothetical protein LCGC14_0505490 [marine sediment metagenome]|uniref:Uncharacterized protein n=1 Tax=marine sediment metagenome TaxID=412755 RepID=A0A0F9S7N8_9ZZZZ|nr:hypothetical protein [archaeon]
MSSAIIVLRVRAEKQNVKEKIKIILIKIRKKPKMEIFTDITRPKVTNDIILNIIKDIDWKNNKYDVIDRIFEIITFFRETAEYKTKAVFLEKSSEIISHEIMIGKVLA